MATHRFSAGVHAVDKLLRLQREHVARLLVDERSKNPRLAELVQRARQTDVPIEWVRSHRLDDLAAGTAHQGVVAELTGLEPLDEAGLRARVEAALTAGTAPLILILDGVQDPHNLGACLRSADAAGVLAVVTPRKAAAGLTPAARKVASGAAEAVPVVAVASLVKVLDWLGNYGIKRVGTSDAASGTFWETSLSGPVALIMGTEERGMAPAVQERCDALVALPMAGVVESLNVSVATGICLFECVRQRSACSSS